MHTSSQQDAPAGRYPLSFTQQYFCTLDEGELAGAFGNKFTIVSALRISGHVDLSTLQGALDDVVERHELLRTVVVRDAQPPYQQVHPPCRMPLEVRDWTPAGRPRDLVAEELIIEAEKETISPRQVPVLRAALTRFDDRDSVLVLVVHHSASDAWSQTVILRDLGAFYHARVTGQPAGLPAVRQYREYAQWQEANTAETGDARRYWREKLRGARMFWLPNDRPRPPVYTRSFSAHNYSVAAAEMAPAQTLARETRSSMFMVLLAAFAAFSYEITGCFDLGINALTTGRDDPMFQNTMGLFLNLVPFRTGIGACATFRDIVVSTRDTCVDAYAHEIPISVINQDLPDYESPVRDPRKSWFLLGMYQAQSADTAALPIADGAHPILDRTLSSSDTSDIPNGLLWSIHIGRAGGLDGNIVYNLDEFDEQRVTGWMSDYHRMLSRLTSEPDSDWRQLTGAAS